MTIAAVAARATTVRVATVPVATVRVVTVRVVTVLAAIAPSVTVPAVIAPMVRPVAPGPSVVAARTSLPRPSFRNGPRPSASSRAAHAARASGCPIDRPPGYGVGGMALGPGRAGPGRGILGLARLAKTGFKLGWSESV